MDLDPQKLPQHIAIIMDGNRRWAKERGLPVVAGHKFVLDTVVEELIDTAGEIGVPFITFWAWSSENWSREATEVGSIMKLFRWALKNKVNRLIKKGARVRVIGDMESFDPDIRDGLLDMIERSKDNTKITVTFALNYGGRDEIVRAVHKAIAHTSHSGLNPESITKSVISQNLDTTGMPDPDMIIRPGGEKRLSGFMLWQSEYAELFFPEIMMPDFRKQQLLENVKAFQGRNRRFGGGSYS